MFNKYLIMLFGLLLSGCAVVTTTVGVATTVVEGAVEVVDVVTPDVFDDDND